MELRFEVENVKCGGCARTIDRKLREDARVKQVAVDPEKGTVVVDAPEEARAEIAGVLAGIGYPERGSVEGLRAAAAAAKSFVSCAVGRLS
jgi:copper chaperone